MALLCKAGWLIRPVKEPDTSFTRVFYVCRYSNRIYCKIQYIANLVGFDTRLFKACTQPCHGGAIERVTSCM